MKRLNKIARRITAYNEEIEQFIKECENSGKFDINQMDVIRRGFKNHLTLEQVKFYAKPEFNWEQMFEICEGFDNNLATMEEVSFYAKPEIHWTQMLQIREDFESGLTIEEVKEKYNL